MEKTKNKGGHNRTYICDWCQHTWSQRVIYDADKGFSTVVVCPNCARTIPTWPVQRFDTGVGRKHRHLRS